MFLICEPVCHEGEHIPFNSGFVSIIRKAFPESEILFCGEKDHIRELKASLPSEISESVRFAPLAVPHRYASFFERFHSDRSLIRLLFRKAKATKTKIVFTNLPPSLLLALKLGSLWSRERCRVQCILHGILSSLKGWKSRNPIIRVQQIETILRLPPNRYIQYIFLERNILSEFMRIHNGPALPNTAVIDHPIPLETLDGASPVYSLPLHIGFLGLASSQKGIDRYLRIVRSVRSRFPDPFRFHIIGRYFGDAGHPDLSLVENIPGKNRLDRKEYVHRVQRLHYVCLPYADKFYSLSPSGVLLDAIAFSIPIIAARIPLFEYLFEKYGDIGFLCETDSDFIRTIESLHHRFDPHRHARQTRNMKRVKAERSPEFLAAKYREACFRFFH